MKQFIVLCVLSVLTVNCFAQTRPFVGAYYFDGWATSGYNSHLTKKLVNNFNNRKPVWGWATSNQSVINAQIDAAADAGLSFFSFCWYYNAHKNIDSTNRALMFYNCSPLKSRLKFCLLVANHMPYEIGPAEWPAVTNEWLKQFKAGNYVVVDGKPLLIFFSVQSLIKKFGSEANVKAVFDAFKQQAKHAGITGITIAACLGAGRTEVSAAANCGFDVLTGYNYSPVGFIKNQTSIPIDNLQKGEINAWNQFPKVTNLPCIPLVTLNWDPRPWAEGNNYYTTTPYYTGYSKQSVYTSVSNAIAWSRSHQADVTRENIIILYAWNEYGEGAWLTPGANGHTELLDGLKSALK